MIEIQKVLACVSVDSINPCIKTSRSKYLSALELMPRDKRSRGSHGLFFLDGPHSGINVFIFEFLDCLPMRFEVDGKPVFRVIGLMNAFVRSRDLFIVGFKHRIFKKETECGHLGDHHPSGAVHLTSKVGVVLAAARKRSLPGQLRWAVFRFALRE